MTPKQLQQAALLWSQGKNTADIARVIGEPEHQVARNIETIRDIARRDYQK